MPYEREGPVLRSLVLFGGHGSVGLLPLFPVRSSGGGNEPEDQRLSDLPSKYHYTWNTNLEVLDDSVRLEYLPLKDAYVNLYKGDRVVVAEFSVHPQDSVDSIWVKVAHSQEVQGWYAIKSWCVRSYRLIVFRSSSICSAIPTLHISFSYSPCLSGSICSVLL